MLLQRVTLHLRRTGSEGTRGSETRQYIFMHHVADKDFRPACLGERERRGWAVLGLAAPMPPPRLPPSRHTTFWVTFSVVMLSGCHNSYQHYDCQPRCSMLWLLQYTVRQPCFFFFLVVVGACSFWLDFHLKHINMVNSVMPLLLPFCCVNADS